MITLAYLAITIIALVTFLAVPYLFLANGLGVVPTQLGLMEILAGLLIIIGLCLFIWVIIAFIKYGLGTPAPFKPTQKFVASGAYHFSRNPMYVGALVILVGEAVLIRAPSLLIFILFLFILFTIYIIVYEEPRLIKSFGASYQNYMKKVPRWISLRKLS
ncbi:MAG: isoprenylcysteine carboxylmethyltransferase family protein [Anaerolineaceae bacterium]|nr:isoprenylcysteine carboxylmethyltransferase family protein [Anaerolineaceae bacterium]MBN2677785.1 isoprenylcysteine carboxylmethyltransferase family protein [Anaerolineaceae bacterium]